MNRFIEFMDGSVEVSFNTAPPSVSTPIHAVAAATAQLMDGIIKREPLAARYRVETSGKSAEEIAAAVNALGDYHAAKCQRIYDAEPLLGTTISIDGKPYTWTCITVMERGTDVQLYVNLTDASGKRPACMPILIVKNSVAALPTNDEMTAIITAAIRAEMSGKAAQSAKLTRVQELLAP